MANVYFTNNNPTPDPDPTPPPYTPPAPAGPYAPPNFKEQIHKPTGVPGPKPSATGPNTTEPPPTPPGTPTPPTTTTTPSGDGWPKDVDPRIAALFRRYGVSPTGRGTGATDYLYWQNEALQNAHGDWGYVLGRLEEELQGKHSNGPGPNGPTTQPRAPFQPLGPGLTGSYNDAIRVIKERYQLYYGKPLSDAALQTILKKYNLSGTTAGTGPTEGGLLHANRLDPNMTGTGQQALDYLNQESQRIRGSGLSQEEIQQAAGLIGYSGGQVTGAQVNQILDELDKRATIRGAGNPGTPGTNRVFTSNDINPILQALYDNVSSGWDSGPGPTTNTGPGPNGNPGGYTDPSSVLYLNQLMQRLAQLNAPQADPWENILKLFALSRAGDLFNGQPYTGGEDAALTAHYMNPLTQARDTELQQNRERISSRGMASTSGLLDVLNRGTNETYSRGVASASNELGVRAVDEKQRRADQALQILSNLLTVNRTGVDRRNALADQAVNVAKMFPDFDLQRFNMLLNASGEGPSTNATLGSIGQLGGLGLQSLISGQNASGNNAALWGQILGALLSQANR